MSRYRSDIIVTLFLIMTSLAVYWQVRNHDFVNYDDDDYVTENRYVKSGWTREGVHWAFTTKFHGHWHPLTWLSHMTDCQLFGLNPGWHHLTSVFLHVANTLLLFLILKRMTGALFQSGFVAVLFGLHPLHVESVAWVADRKDVLSTFFWMLAMWAYVRYSEHPGFNRYLLVLLAFILGLMAKPMVVTLPFIFLLMDYWPLGRIQFAQSSGGRSRQTHKFLILRYQSTVALRLIWEKVPLFVAAGASVVIAMLVRQYQTTPSLSLSELWPTESPIADALFSYMRYIVKMLWPHNLATPYPKPGMLPIWQVGGVGLLLLSISILVFWRGRRHPYLPVGWLWYLITLVPVIGVVKGSPHGMADRYTYVPLIGLFIMIAWGGPDILARWRYRRIVLGISTGMLLLALMMCTWLQVRHWKNSIALFKHTLNVTANNYVAHNNLGTGLEQQGRLEEAISHYSEALRIKPDYAKAHNNLGVVLKRQGRFEEAISHYSEALRIEPAYPEAHNNLGVVLRGQGRLEEAMSHYSEALRIKPAYAEAHNNLGVALALQGSLKEAVGHFSEALRIKPPYAEAHNNLGVVLEGQGRLEEAMSHYSEALRIEPAYADAHNNLGVVLWRQGRLEEAIGHFSEALRIKPAYADAHNNLGVVLKGQGRLEEAIEHFAEAVRIKPDYASAQDNLQLTLQLMGKRTPNTVSKP